MPKREKTPPPAADEPKYLTVVHPYPPHANLELEGERKELAYWLASCTGKDPLLAFFYKPQVRARAPRLLVRGPIVAFRPPLVAGYDHH